MKPSFARKNGFSWIKLDVVDTNPRTKALYQRLRFKTIKVKETPFSWTPIYSFSRVYTKAMAIKSDKKQVLRLAPNRQ
ncbi:MAG: hypothetical protein ACTSVM_05835 [Candidatus Ranarchaeia archaeon]